MRKTAVVLGTAHRKREAGKRSPDNSLREYAYSREIIAELKPKLEDYGVSTFVDYAADDLPKTMQTPSTRLELQRELALRVNAVNSICQRFGRENVIYVSIHNDAMGSDGKWHDAHGWSVRVSPQASAQSKLLADSLYDAAKAHGLSLRQPTLEQKYWLQSLYVLNRTACAAVLTENLFQDNREDVRFLLSDEGRHVIERLHLEGIIRYIETRETT